MLIWKPSDHVGWRPRFHHRGSCMHTFQICWTWTLISTTLHTLTPTGHRAGAARSYSAEITITLALVPAVDAGWGMQGWHASAFTLIVALDCSSAQILEPSPPKWWLRKLTWSLSHLLFCSLQFKGNIYFRKRLERHSAHQSTPLQMFRPIFSTINALLQRGTLRLLFECHLAAHLQEVFKRAATTRRKAFSCHLDGFL